MKKLMK